MTKPAKSDVPAAPSETPPVPFVGAADAKPPARRFRCRVTGDPTVPAIVVEADSGHAAEAKERYLALVGVVKTEHPVHAEEVAEGE